MFKISSNGIITMTRGDCRKIPLFINANNRMYPVRYKLLAGDKVLVHVTQANELFEDALIKKCYTPQDLNYNGDVMVSFESKDTFYLVPGTYYYEVKLVNGHRIKNIVPRTKFVIVE